MKYISFLLLLLIVSCAPVMSTKISNKNYINSEAPKKVFVIYNDTLPKGSEFIGDIRFHDAGMSTDCNYQDILKGAKKKSAESGANILMINKIIAPGFSSSCYGISGKMYRNTNAAGIDSLTKLSASKSKPVVHDSIDYATVYIYRSNNFHGSFIKYDVWMDNVKHLGKAKKGFKKEIKIKDFGEHYFSNEINAEFPLTINIQRGRKYYLRCGIRQGALAGTPDIYFIEEIVGKYEYDLIKDE